MTLRGTCSALAFVVSLAVAAPPAMAQDANSGSTASSGGEGLGEIVVTARRVAENLQSVPVAVTAFNASDLRAQGARTTTDIQTLTPNLRLREAGGNPSALVLAIRGQVQNDILGTLDPSIGTYVDDVYYSRAIGLTGGLLDLAQVEVLKGPQGTLFGRNTTGGALNITTNRPDATAIGGSVRADVGNYGRFNAEGVLNLPIVQDKLALRIAGQRQKSTGYGYDLVSGQRLAGTDNYTIRGKLRWTPDDRLDVTLMAEHFNLDQNGPVQNLRYVSPTTVINNPAAPAPITVPATPEIIAALTTGGCFDLSLLAGLGPTFSCPGPSTYRPGSRTFASYISSDPYTVALTSVPRVTAKTTTASAVIAYDLGEAVLKYIGAYREVESNNPIDIDGTPFTILQTTTFQKSHSWSHELQLAGKAFGTRLDYTIGAYRFSESGTDGSNTFALPVLNPANPSATLGYVANKALAFYGQTTFHVTDAFSLTGGLRWSQDKKRLDSRSTVAGACVVPTSLLNNPGVACSAIFNRTDEAVSYTLSANYQLTRDVLVYAKTSRGYRGGGFNLRGTSVLSFTPFNPEKVTDYELGLKSEFLDRHARINVALFQSEYKDIQKSTIVANGSGGTATIVANAASARIKGLEAEVTLLPVEGLRLTGTLGITDAKYKSFPAVCVFPGGPAAGTPCDRSAEPFEQIPKYTWSLSGEYRHPVAGGEAALRLDYSYSSSFVSQAITYTQTPALAPLVTQPGYGLLNGRISWATGTKGLEVAVWARNLADKRYYAGFLDFVNSGLGYIEGQPGVPRTWGVEIGYSF